MTTAGMIQFLSIAAALMLWVGVLATADEPVAVEEAEPPVVFNR